MMPVHPLEAVVWLLPASVLLAGLRSPRAALLIFVAALPFFGSPPGGPYHGAFDTAAVAAIVVSWRSPRQSPSASCLPIRTAVIVSALGLLPLAYSPPSWEPAMLLQTLTALPGAQSWSVFYSWRVVADLSLGWGLSVAVIRNFDHSSARKLCGAVSIGLSAVVLLGLCGFLDLVDLGNYRSTTNQRMSSVFFNSGWFAEYLVVATPFACFSLARTRSRLSSWLSSALAASSIVCILFAQQRGAWIAVLTQLGFLGFVYRRELVSGVPRRVLASVALTILLVVTAVAAGNPASVRSVISRLDIRSWELHPRSALWATAVEMFAEAPLWGSGVGTFGAAHDRIHPRGTQQSRYPHATAHNTALQIAAETGLLGLLGAVTVTTALILRLAAWRGDRLAKSHLAAGLACSLVGAAVYGLVQHMFFVKCVAFLIWIIIGVSFLRGGEDPAWLTRWCQILLAAATIAVPVRMGQSPTELAGSELLGFHQWEESRGARHRWTEAFAAKRVTVRGPWMVLQMANGHPHPGDRPVEVTINVDGTRVSQLTLLSWEWVPISVPMPNDRPSVLVEITAKPAFRPFHDFRRYPAMRPKSADVRALGVATRGIEWLGHEVSPSFAESAPAVSANH